MWYEIKIDTVTEAVEAIYPILYEYGLSGIVTQDPSDPIYSAGYQGDWDYFEESARQFDYDGARLIGYIELDKAPVDLVKPLKQRIIDLKQYNIAVGPVNINYGEVREEDWANEWKKYYKPHHITDSIVIVPEWEDYQNNGNEITIILNPGKAFGTGTHETTELCGRLIAAYATGCQTMYDIGCGSGILAIIGRTLGVQHVVGVDLSEDAIMASRENMQLNAISDIEFTKGDLTVLPQKPADLIVANIIADVIIDMAPQLVDKLSENGHFIGSGILNERLPEVVTALQANGFTIVETRSKGEWSAVVAK